MQEKEKTGLALTKMSIVEQLRQEKSEAMRETITLKTHFHCKEFSASELEKATNNFHPSQKIGEGGYGPVYRGFLGQTAVAIKVLKPESRQGATEFQQEVTHTELFIAHFFRSSFFCWGHVAEHIFQKIEFDFLLS